MNLLQAIADPNLFGPWFRTPETWAAWRAFTAALFGLPMSESEATTFRLCTGRDVAPDQPFSEAWLIVGRRGGKSFELALIAVFLAAFREYRPYLAPGERGIVLVIATDRRQARTIFRYARALLSGVPMLKRLVERESAEEIDLSNGVTLEVGTSSYRSVRGRTLVAGLCDELAFWPSDDSADPDYAILDALRPAMATIPQAMLLCASSPYARRGALWDAYRRHYGHDGPVLVWQAPTQTMNPTIRQSVIDEAMERDPASASAEYLAQFRTDVETFVAREVVERAVPIGLAERAPLAGVSYRAFVDPSGGVSDSMTLAIAHHQGERSFLDAVRERKPPFSPEAVVSEFADLMKLYRISVVTGDRYGGEWPREAFRRHGIEYRPAEQTKSTLYVDLLPQLNSGHVELLDLRVLINQLTTLERRTARGGRDSIDHAPGSHDDVANAVAGALAGRRREVPMPVFGTYGLGGGSDDVKNWYATKPPEYWAARGTFHPNDRQHWIDAGVYKPEERQS